MACTSMPKNSLILFVNTFLIFYGFVNCLTLSQQRIRSVFLKKLFHKFCCVASLREASQKGTAAGLRREVGIKLGRMENFSKINDRGGGGGETGDYSVLSRVFFILSIRACFCKNKRFYQTITNYY